MLLTFLLRPGITLRRQVNTGLGSGIPSRKQSSRSTFQLALSWNNIAAGVLKQKSAPQPADEQSLKAPLRSPPRGFSFADIYALLVVPTLHCCCKRRPPSPLLRSSPDRCFRL